MRARPGRRSHEPAEDHPGAQHDRSPLETAREPAHPGSASDSAFGDPRGRPTDPRPDRGEGAKGKSAGSGTKGTKPRNGVPVAFEGGQMPIHMRLPKLKGFRNRFKVEFQVVNLERLAELFPSGGEVGPDELVEAGAVRKGQPVKVLGDGDL